MAASQTGLDALGYQITHVGSPRASTDAATLAYTDAAAKTFLPVANGTHFNGNGGAASTSLIQTRCRQTRKLLRVIAGGATRLQVEWANIWTSNTPQAADASCEINGPNSVTARMSIEYPAGNPRIVSGSAAWSSATAYALLDQVTYGGNSWVAIQAGTNQTPAAGSAYWRLVTRYVVNWETQTDASGTVVFTPGAYLKSLPVALAEPTARGDLIAVLGAFDSGSSGNYIPYAGANGASNTVPFVDWVVDAAGGLPAVGSALPDIGVTTQTNGNTTTADSTTASSWMKIPYATAITGNIPTKRCVALFGDSLMAGAGGDIRDGEPCGMFVRGVDTGTWWRLAQGGNRAGCYVPGNAPWQMSVVARCSAVLTNLGAGDVQANLTFAQTQTAMVRLWKMLAATGTPVCSGMFAPISNSTDGWTTLANQSRWTNAGASNTTQFPTDDATFLTSVYGLTQMWLGQDGASLSVDTASVKVGEFKHPLVKLFDWRMLMADPATAWKWSPGYTGDGAHPNAVAAQVQGIYLAGQLEPVLMGRQATATVGLLSPVGEPPLQSMPRSAVATRSATPITGSLVSVVGISEGRYYYGFRSWAGTSSAKSWTMLVGMDPAKLKVAASGSFTPTADAIRDTALPGAPFWIPQGQVVAMVLTTPAANAWGGQLAYAAGLHKTGLGFVIAGSSADTAVLTGVVSLFSAAKFTEHAFRAWVELY